MGLTIAILVFLVLLFFIERAKPDLVLRIEENILASILAIMTLVSFAQVIARYGFNTGWGGALEFTRILFAWLILFGMSYGIKTKSHLGVDALIRLLPKKAFKPVALFGAFCSVLYGVILLSGDWLQYLGAEHARGGAIFYWNKFFQIGIGLEDLRYPEWFYTIFGVQERVHRWLAYLILPVGLALFSYRCTQAFIQIWRGERELMIAGHEAEDLVEENIDTLRD